ncbi:Cytochrome C oxidase, cbb3-type, subunit III [Parapedobacter indicus]|uniref:Cytochrome C oxidase, cbb3-type, subunit III n=1 Tax=Parapedobacter indicus TaxID=1477437 RepID=A0A1I3VQL8_9SPHI|nr:cbb3-type cytochrome c oxidase subunit III [Parapedobacter indicus]SFJ97223.1 Cytochrome C oxidase, cbb3-type, subunit III [Parapedobacter indicus]
MFTLVRCGNKEEHGVLSPQASIKAMEVEDGFEVELVASEPLVVAPVAMTFDNHGRIWLAEMEGYMPDTLGTGEEEPVGRIVILTDEDGDGQVDDRKIFLDSLVMPRALCLVNGGLLVAEPPKLWFYEMKDDKPRGRTLVDSAYAEGGNVEHQPNGLFRALDNWIYSAKYDWRYRRADDGQWLKEKTHFRGQWGISHDDWGRLYYNDNSSNLSGDYFPPGLGAGNPNQRRVAGYGETIVADKRVYPIHPTTGVNRGYMEGILDSTGRLVNFTAACGPLIYRGGLLSGMNAFVAEPSANLIKRNVLHAEGFRVVGKQAYEGREFLASDDERFRPVNLYDGPDGSLYILDMYRGIIQHNTYLTPYLKSEIAKRNLTLPLSMGRIYRVFPRDAKRVVVTIPENTDSLISLLAHPNGWVRDQAQRTLIDRQAIEVATKLRNLLKKDNEPLPAVHALWTLEGLGQLTSDDIRIVLEHPRWEVRAQALAALTSLKKTVAPDQLKDLLTVAISPQDTVLAPYAMLAMASLANERFPEIPALSNRLAEAYANDRYVSDAFISGLGGHELTYLDEMERKKVDTSTVLHRRLVAVVDAINEKSKSKDQALLAKRYPKGTVLFQTACQPCHGEDGRGVSPIAPPLAGSEWVKGNKERLMSLVLYGLTGPVDVAGHTYKTPEVSGEMPGIAHNPAIGDAELAELLSYIRNAWGNNVGDEVLPEDLGAIRSRFGDRAEPFVQSELHKLFGKD